MHQLGDGNKQAWLGIELIWTFLLCGNSAYHGKRLSQWRKCPQGFTCCCGNWRVNHCRFPRWGKFMEDTSEVMWGMGQEGFKEEELKFANDIQILTGSRCRRLRVGGMCCQGLVQLRILAAKFCGYWSLSRALNGTPNRTQLPWSSWEVLKSRIKISGMVWSCGWGSRGWIWWHNLCVTHKMSLRRKWMTSWTSDLGSVATISVFNQWRDRVDCTALRYIWTSS